MLGLVRSAKERGVEAYKFFLTFDSVTKLPMLGKIRSPYKHIQSLLCMKLLNIRSRKENQISFCE